MEIDGVGCICQFKECNRYVYLYYKCELCEKFYCFNHKNDHNCKNCKNITNIKNSNNKIQISSKCHVCNKKNLYELKCSICNKEVCLTHRYSDCHECLKVDTYKKPNEPKLKEVKNKSNCIIF